jgi:hypothetical protein
MRIFLIFIIMAILIVIESFITYKVNGGDIMLILFGLIDAPILIYLNDKINK